MAKNIIVDGFNLLWRAHYGFPARVRSSAGEDITSIFGFFALLRAEVTKIGLPASLIICFDGQFGTSHKRETLPIYKENRKGMDLSALKFLSQIKEGLTTQGIPWIEHERIEADELIASLAKRAAGDVQTVILSNDKDFVQLISKTVTVWTGTIRTVFDQGYILQKFGIRPDQWPEFLAMVGDKSDNIPGLPGIGKVRAARLLQKYDSIVETIENDMCIERDLDVVRQHKSDFLKYLSVIRFSEEFFELEAIESPIFTQPLMKAPELIKKLGMW